MHEVIQNGLEEYLAGNVRREFQTHLEQCGACREEVSEFSAVSSAFAAFRQDAELQEAVVPEPGFYYRLSQNIETQKAASPWSLFSINAVFGRRLAFASLMTLAVLGGFLISREADMRPEQEAPETIMARHDYTVAHAPGTDRDHMLVTLASYSEP